MKQQKRIEGVKIMGEIIINNIIQNHKFYQLNIRKEKQKLEIENENYIVSIIFYNNKIAEEIIYDKRDQDTFFYFHHDCINYQQSLTYIDEFLEIVFELINFH